MCIDSVMNEDLEPFEKLGGITKDLFDRSHGRGTHYQIIKHRLYRENECMFPFRQVISWTPLFFNFVFFTWIVIFKTAEIRTISDGEGLLHMSSIH